MRVHCWLKLRRHHWGEWFVLEAPTRFALARECVCGAFDVRRTVEGIASDGHGTPSAVCLAEWRKAKGL